MYSLGEANKIKVYSNLGRVIKDQIRDIMGQGSHQRRWHLCQSQYKESGVTLRVSTEYPRRGRSKKKKNPIQALRDMKDGNTSSR